MLPFTTYKIPESTERETPLISKWLWIVTGHDLSPQNEDLLQKITTALKADIASDVFVVKVDPNEKISISSFTGRDPKLIISFGIEPSALGIWIDLTGPGIRFLEKFVFIQSDTLDALYASPTGKKKLWTAMQMFLEMN